MASTESARGEKGLKDGRARRQRLTFMGEYEAVRQPAKGGAVAWTWSLTDEFLRNIEASVRDAIRHRRDDREIARAIELYHRLPGFRGVRHQVASLRRFTIAEWKRVRGEGRCPHLPPRVQPYVRYRRYAQVDLALVLARLGDGLPPFAWEWRYPTSPTVRLRAEEAPPHEPAAQHPDEAADAP